MLPRTGQRLTESLEALAILRRRLQGQPIASGRLQELALFGQLSGPISDTFHASDATIGVALALTRLGALFALFAIAIADRRGRRTSILVGVVGSAVVCALSAIAPNLASFTVRFERIHVWPSVRFLPF